MVAAVFLATLTGIAAQIKVYLPFTPVPITLQTTVVLLSGVLLGKKGGVLSQIFYVVLGVIGLPWFANGQGGLAYAMGPTAGYLMGFILAAFVMGWLQDHSSLTRQWLSLLGVMLLCHAVLIYGFGLLYLAVWSNLLHNLNKSFIDILWMGCVPFLLGDLAKILATSSLIHFFHRKTG